MNYYPQFTSQFTPQFTPQNSITWVQGLEGAKAYPVGAGNSVLLLDSDNQYLYIKSADSVGMPTLRTFEYKEITNVKEEQRVDLSGYVTKEELEEALNKLKPKKKKVIEVEDDE